MLGIMDDRLQSYNVRNALGIAFVNNQSDPSPPSIEQPPASGVSQYNIDTRILPLFASYVATAQAQSGRYNMNRSIDDVLAAMQKLKSQNSFAGAQDLVAQLNLLTDIKQTTSSQHTNTESPPLVQSFKFLLANATVKNDTTAKQHEIAQREEIVATLPKKKRSSSLSSNNNSLKKKKSVPIEGKALENNIPTFSMQLSDSERKESFPLPPRPKLSISKLSSFSKLWDDCEMISYNMDDTVADQRAFVKKLFVQSLHRSKMSHLKQRTQLVSTTTKMPK